MAVALSPVAVADAPPPLTGFAAIVSHVASSAFGRTFYSTMTGNKDDHGKPRFSLIPPYAYLEVAKALTHGAASYGDDNWREVIGEDGSGTHRYVSACFRHINAWQRGEKIDRESRLHHLAHAICCLMFLAELELELD